MLDQRFYQTAIELQALGLKAHYDEAPSLSGYVIHRDIVVQIEGLPEVRVSLTDRQRGKIEATLFCDIRDGEGRLQALSSHKTIGFSSSKSATQMAKDIHTRLLTPSLEELRHNLDRFNAAQEHANKRYEVIKRAAELAGVPERVTKLSTTDFYGLRSRLPGLRQVQVSGSSTPVLQAYIEELTLDQFERICEVLKTP